MSASVKFTGAEIRDIITNAICDYDEKARENGSPQFPTNSISHLIKAFSREIDKRTTTTDPISEMFEMMGTMYGENKNG